MNRSILIPLDELKKGADMIAGGDLDYRIPIPDGMNLAISAMSLTT